MSGEVNDTERFNWFFGPANKLPAMAEYMRGVAEGWSLDQWRAYCDRHILSNQAQKPQLTGTGCTHSIVTIRTTGTYCSACGVKLPSHD